MAWFDLLLGFWRHLSFLIFRSFPRSHRNLIHDRVRLPACLAFFCIATALPGSLFLVYENTTTLLVTNHYHDHRLSLARQSL